MNSAWCDDACVDCGAPVDYNHAALCTACTSLYLRKQPIASSSRLALTVAPESTVHEDEVADAEPDSVVSISSEALHRTKSQTIRAWVADLTSASPSRAASFESIHAPSPRTPSPRRSMSPTSLTTPRAGYSPRSPQSFTRPSLLRPSMSAASLRVCRNSSKGSMPATSSTAPNSTATSPTICTPAPRPMELPICASGSSVAYSVMRSIRTWMPITPTPSAECVPRTAPTDNYSSATLVDLAAPFEKAALFDTIAPVNDLDDLVEDADDASSTSSYSSAAELPHAELGKRVALKASRHRASHLRLAAVAQEPMSYTGRRLQFSYTPATA